MWVIWKTFDDQLEPAIAEFERWGVKGVKVDFMQRDDQPVMRFYPRICRALRQDAGRLTAASAPPCWRARIPT
jgi:alpha-glucosidase